MYIFVFCKGIDHCPGFFLENVTTTTQVDHRTQPIIFHLERDPQEKYPIHPWTGEYREQHSILQQIVSHHQSHLEPTEPQLNWCDDAVMVNYYQNITKLRNVLITFYRTGLLQDVKN